MNLQKTNGFFFVITTQQTRHSVKNAVKKMYTYLISHPPFT